MQLRALPGLKHAKHQHTDKGAEELGQRGEQVQDPEVDACRFARGGGVGGGTVSVPVEVVQAKEGGRRGDGREILRGVGEAAVRRVVGGGRSEAVDFDPHEGKRGPAGKRPGSNHKFRG